MRASYSILISFTRLVSRIISTNVLNEYRHKCTRLKKSEIFFLAILHNKRFYFLKKIDETLNENESNECFI